MKQTSGRSPWLLLALALFANATPLPLHAATLGTADETAAQAETRAIDDAIARHALFAMLAEDQSAFRGEWERRHRLRVLLQPDAGKDSNSVSHIGLGLAMDAAKPYLMRTSDAAANRFLATLGKVIAEGEKNAGVCLAFVEAGGSEISNNNRREIVESMLGEQLLGEMLQSLADVVAGGRAGEKRVLLREELATAIQPVILQMAQAHGTASLRDLAKVNDRGAAPQERCRAMAQMLQAFAAQPEARRAMLARTLFSGALPRVQ